MELVACFVEIESPLTISSSASNTEESLPDKVVDLLYKRLIATYVFLAKICKFSDGADERDLGWLLCIMNCGLM
jgi:hypothetical protein